MLTAILISGQIRSAADYAESIIKNIITPFNSDVFIHTWAPESNSIDRFGRKVENSLTIDDLKNIFKPKIIETEIFESTSIIPNDINIEEIKKVGYNGTNSPETVVKNVFYMHYKIWKCNQLRKKYERLNNIRYDQIIKIRFDVGINTIPLIKIEPQKIYIPHEFDHRGGYNDLIACGDSLSMDIYCDLYKKMKEYASSNIGFHPESLLRYHLEKNELEIERFDMSYTFNGISRGIIKIHTSPLKYLCMKWNKYHRN